MIVEAAQKRLKWKLWAAALLIDVVVAVLAARFFAEDGERLTTAFWIWVGIQAVGLAFSILGVVHLVTAYWLGAFNSAREAFLSVLQEHNFPPPQRYEFSVDYYLGNVADDDEGEIKARVAAAFLLGMRKGTAETTGILRKVFLDRAHESALKEYEQLSR